MSFRFSEEARLYAEYLPVVEEMKRAYQQSLNKFFDALTLEVRRRLLPDALQFLCHKGHIYWWLSNDEDADPEIEIWGPLDDPQLVLPGKIELWAAAPRLSQALQLRLRDVAKQPDVAAWCRHKKMKDTLFAIEVTYGPNDDPVERTAEPIALVLRALSKAYIEGAGADGRRG